MDTSKFNVGATTLQKHFFFLICSCLLINRHALLVAAAELGGLFTKVEVYQEDKHPCPFHMTWEYLPGV